MERVGIFFTMPILNHKKFTNLLNWKFDKTTINDSKVKKIEVYNYIPRKEVPKLIKYFNRKTFHRTDDSKNFHSVFNIILSHEWEHIYKNEIITDTLRDHKYYYFVDFARVLSHRWSNFLIKIYRNKAQNKNFSKVEITYWRHKWNYNLSYWDWASRIKGIAEVINLIEKRVKPIGFAEDFSKKQDIRDTISLLVNQYSWNKQEKLIKLLS